MTRNVFIYANDSNVIIANVRDVIITNVRANIQGYKFVCSILYTVNNVNIDSASSIYIYNEDNNNNCSFYMKTEMFSLYCSSNQLDTLRFKNDSMKALFEELYDKLIIAWDDIDDHETPHEILNLVNIINRCSNQFSNRYCSFIEELSNDIPFKALTKSAN